MVQESVEKTDLDIADKDLSEKILGVLARIHPRRPTRRDLVQELTAQLGIGGRRQAQGVAQRVGWLISNGLIEERLTLNDMAPRVRLSGSTLLGVNVNVEALRAKSKSQHQVISDIITATRIFIEEYWPGNLIPPIIIRDVNIVHGSDRFDILLTVLHANEIHLWKDTGECESIITYYVREVIQKRVADISGTCTMSLAASRAYPMDRGSRRASVYEDVSESLESDVPAASR